MIYRFHYAFKTSCNAFYEKKTDTRPKREIGHQKTYFEFLSLISIMMRYIFHRIFFGSKDTPDVKMRKIKAVASGYLMMYYFNIYWTPMRSIFKPQALKMCCKPTFGALKYA